jgi:sulfate permease, SulP family
MLPWSVTEFVHYPWYALPDLAGNLIAVIFVTASSTLFNTTGIEVAVHREADLERELNVAGIANMLSGAFGGYTGCISVSRSVLNFNADGTGRLSAALTARRRFRHRCWPLPRPARLLAEIRARRSPDLSRCGHAAQMDRAVAAPAFPDRYLSLLVIIAIILQWGFIAGILIGVVISCTTFALSASRIDSIEFGFDGSEYRSSLDRSRDDQAVLSAHGGKIQGLNMAARRGCAASAVTPPSAKWVWSRTPRAARPFRPRSQAFSMS